MAEIVGSVFLSVVEMVVSIGLTVVGVFALVMGVLTCEPVKMAQVGWGSGDDICKDGSDIDGCGDYDRICRRF